MSANGKPTGRRHNRDVRPERRTDRINVSLPLWLIEWLRAQDESQAMLIRQALIKHYRLQTRGKYLPRYEWQDKQDSGAANE